MLLVWMCSRTIGGFCKSSLYMSSPKRPNCSCKHLKATGLDQGERGAFAMGVKHLFLLVLLVCAASRTRRCDATLAPALFVLGDSTVDTGNQNYITSVIKSNYPPYGEDFVPPGPTGRFSNGKLANDFLAEYLGIPFPVNFLAPTAKGSVLLTGVNLASSGSGYLDITGQILGVVNLTRQLENLGTIQAEIMQQIGQPATMDLFSKAVYLISTGSNDFANNYDINPILQRSFTPAAYQQFVLDSINTNLNTLYNYGARKVIMNGLGPVGCTPEQLNFYNSKTGSCLENINGPLLNFNSGLKSLIYQLRSEHSDFDLLYANVYDPILQLIENPTAYGYLQQSSNTACCGEGIWKGAPCVNPLSDVCSNPDQYIFWDFFHPSQITYQRLANGVISGDTSIIEPNNLSEIL